MSSFGTNCSALFPKDREGVFSDLTDTIHTSLSLTLSVFREHNSPSGNYTCRARWPEGLLCWLSQFLKSNIVQNFKTHIVHNVDFKFWASRTMFCDFAPSICVPKCQNLTFWAKYHRQTDGRTDTQTRFTHLYPWPYLYFANTIALRAKILKHFS